MFLQQWACSVLEASDDRTGAGDGSRSIGGMARGALPSSSTTADSHQHQRAVSILSAVADVQVQMFTRAAAHYHLRGAQDEILTSLLAGAVVQHSSTRGGAGRAGAGAGAAGGSDDAVKGAADGGRPGSTLARRRHAVASVALARRAGALLLLGGASAGVVSHLALVYVVPFGGASVKPRWGCHPGGGHGAVWAAWLCARPLVVVVALETTVTPCSRLMSW